MDKKELLKLLKEPKYIPGIYNYCDRWCERCSFTSRCLSYSIEQEPNDEFGDIDEINERFWDRMKESFKLAFSLIEDLAKEQGISLESMNIDEEDDIDNKVNILTHLAMNYTKLVDEWFKNKQALLENVFITSKKPSHLKSVSSNSSEIPMSVEEVVEVINYYKYAITVKLSRAIKSRDNEANMRLEEMSKDSDGSAKIALIEIERSMSAWSELLKYFDTEKKDILKIICHLKQILEMAEKEFPQARSFIRPGLDQIA